jgi:methyl-accepting chemotaxis protein
VVAAGVRSLAKPGDAAAKVIKTLIGDSVAKVETGSRQVDAAESLLRLMVHYGA